MKTTKYFIIIIIGLTLLILLSGCSEESILSTSSTDQKDSVIRVQPDVEEPELAVSASVPSPFRIVHSDFIDFKNEMATRLSLSDYQVTSENAGNNSIRENNVFAYHFHEVTSLTEFYFVTVEIEEFELVALEIDGHGLTFIYRCAEAIGGSISIDIERALRTDESWRILTEQLTRDGRGHLTESGMIYQPGLSRISARIGTTRMSIRVPDTLNNYEFLRDLAFDVIETSRPVVVEEDFFRRYLEAIIRVDDSMDVYYGSAHDVWVYWDIIPASVRITGEIEFSSADTNIVEVDSEGLIIAVSIGQTTVTITVPTELGVLRAEVTVNVLAQP